MPALYTPRPLVLATAYSELKRLALEQTTLLIGTPGSVSARDVEGSTFLYRQFYDPEGKKKADYLGPASDGETIARADALREQIAATNGLLEQARFLARQGYVRVDVRTGAIVAALANRGLFRAGAVLVGSHAFGALLNELGIASAPYLTEDIDIARGARLILTDGPSFEESLRASAVPLGPILGFDRKAPPTSYKVPGKDRLRVDLLIPGRGREVTVRAVPELAAHAQAMPHLDYLLEDPMEGILLGRESVVPIKIPRPERYACHKMLVSQRRGVTSDKRSKDLNQAAVLFAFLADTDAAALRDAYATAPAKATTKAGAEQVLRLMTAARHERAVDLLNELL